MNDSKPFDEKDVLYRWKPETPFDDGTGRSVDECVIAREVRHGFPCDTMILYHDQCGWGYPCSHQKVFLELLRERTAAKRLLALAIEPMGSDAIDYETGKPVHELIREFLGGQPQPADGGKE